VDALPVAFDSLLKEYAVPRPDEMTYAESFTHPPFNTGAKDDGAEPPSWIKDKTRLLNEVSDYGDAVIRFRKHAPLSINPSMFAESMPHISYLDARTTGGINYSGQGKTAESYTKRADGSSANHFFGFSGNVCKTCGDVKVIFVGEFPPMETASERHLATLKQEKHLPNLALDLPSLKAELLGQLSGFVGRAFEGKKYLYCKWLDIEEDLDTLTQNREAVESRMGIPGKFNLIKMSDLRLDYWTVRVSRRGRAEISEIEETQFLKNAQATYAICWTELDGLPMYYFMWIDKEKPYFRMQSAEILRRLGSCVPCDQKWIRDSSCDSTADRLSINDELDQNRKIFGRVEPTPEPPSDNPKGGNADEEEAGNENPPHLFR
jgi:hypothetical protein